MFPELIWTFSLTLQTYTGSFTQGEHQGEDPLGQLGDEEDEHHAQAGLVPLYEGPGVLQGVLLTHLLFLVAVPLQHVALTEIQQGLGWGKVG